MIRSPKGIFNPEGQQAYDELKARFLLAKLFSHVFKFQQNVFINGEVNFWSFHMQISLSIQLYRKTIFSCRFALRCCI